MTENRTEPTYSRDSLNTKIATIEEISPVLKTARKLGKKIVFTNGCFDILHAGHVSYLFKAKTKGDILIVGLNSDSSIRAIKGDGRPIIEQNQRCIVLSALECVDFVVIFNETDPISLIKAVKPDILVKGADWGEEEVVGANLVRSWQGKVERIDIVPGVSTTKIIEKIRGLAL